MNQAQLATRILVLVTLHRDDPEAEIVGAVRKEVKRAGSLAGTKPWIEYALSVREAMKRVEAEAHQVMGNVSICVDGITVGLSSLGR